MPRDSVWAADCGILATLGLLVAARLLWGHVYAELGIPAAMLLGALLGCHERGR
jgi:hypothetical protein